MTVMIPLHFTNSGFTYRNTITLCCKIILSNEFPQIFLLLAESDENCIVAKTL